MCAHTHAYMYLLYLKTGRARVKRGHRFGGLLTSASVPLCHILSQVSGQSAAQTAQVRLLVNNSQTPDAANLSDLVLLDNVTGLTIRASPGNKTAAGFQAFRRKFLQGEGSVSRGGQGQ